MFVTASQDLVQRERSFVPLQISMPATSASMAKAQLHWLDVGNQSFSEPFLHQTLQQHLQRPFNRLIRPVTMLAELPESIANDSDVEIVGFIFHVSRCGSTLLCQMLSQDPETTVLAEPEVLDQLFRMGEQRGEHNLELVRALIKALGRNRNDNAKRCVVKLDSWHARFAPLLRAAFPEVPWIVLYREPCEVYGSNLQVPSSQMVPGNLSHLPLGMSLMDAVQMPHERYVAIKLAQIFEDIWHLSSDPRALLLNYQLLPKPGFERMLQQFRLTPKADTLARMLALSTQDAKQPGTHFQPDGAKKRARLQAQEMADCSTYLTPIYQRLEQRRAQYER